MKKYYISLLLLLTSAESFGTAAAASKLSRLPTFSSLGSLFVKHPQSTLSGRKYIKKGYLDQPRNEGNKSSLPTTIAAALMLEKAKNKIQGIKQIETKLKTSPNPGAIQREK